MKKGNYRGCEKVTLVSYNEWSDPDLFYEYQGTEYCFNFWDIEDALWSMFCESFQIDDSKSGDEETENKFSKYVQELCSSYLKHVIVGGYFKKGSTSWHDN